MNVTDSTENLAERMRALEEKLEQLQNRRDSIPGVGDVDAVASGGAVGPADAGVPPRDAGSTGWSLGPRDDNGLIELLQIQSEELSVQREELQIQNEELMVQSEELASSKVLVELERQRYRDLFDFAPDGYLVTDADGTIREANRAAASMLGKHQDFLVGKPIAVFLEGRERRAFRSALIALHTGDANGELEIDLYPTGRPSFRAALTVAAMRDYEGRPVGLRWLLRDVTARHEAEQEAQRLNRELEARVAARTRELEEANRKKEEALAGERTARFEAELAGRRLRDMVNGLGAIIWEADPATHRYSYVSEHAVTMLGYPMADWMEEGFTLRLIHPDDLALVVSLRRQAVEDRRDDDIEYRVRTASGVTLWVRELFQVVSDEQGYMKGVRGVIVDVNHQHEAEQALRDNELRFRRLVDSNIIGVAFCDQDGRLIGANDAFLQMVSYSKYHLMSGELNWARLTPAEYIPLERRAAAQARGSGVFTPFEKEFIRSDGTRVPVLVGGAYLDERSREFVCFALDLTEQKRVLEELRVRDRAVAAAANGVIIADPALPDMPMVYVNPAIEAITGYTPEELIGRNPRLLQGPDTDQAVLDEIRRAIVRRRSCRATLLNYRKDGTPFWCELTIAPVRNPGGHVSHYVGIMQDVTAQKEAEREIGRLNEDLRERIAELTTLLEVIPIGILISRDPECRDVTVNPAMVEILPHLAANLAAAPPVRPADRFSREEADLEERGQEELRQAELPILRAIGERRTVSHVDFEVTSGGQRRSLASYAAPLFDSEGDVRGAVGAFVDISEIRRAEEESRAMRAAAERASEAKDRFLAILSHELRTPMTPVVTAAQLLVSHPELPGELHPLIDIISRNVELEVRLIDDLLDLTGIENGKLKLRSERVDLHRLLPGVLEMFQDSVIEKGLRVVLEPAAGSHIVSGDSSRLHQIFWNLLKNAVKFTPVGGSIAIRTHNDGDRRIVVDVEDTGIGIEPELMRSLFDPFVQGARRGEFMGFSGLGLGLAICRALVELHGGTIDVRSRGADQGSVFSVTLDCLPERGSAPYLPLISDEPPMTAGAGLSVLLVDDHHDTRRVLELLLSRAGYSVIPAGSVAEGLAAARGSILDLVISDIGLPDGTGHDLLKAIRAERPVPAIALSGFGMETDVRQSLDAGFAVHLTKPVSFQQIQRAIERILVSSGPGPEQG